MLLWLDLTDGPMVIETPPDVIGLEDDTGFHYVDDFGQDPEIPGQLASIGIRKGKAFDPENRMQKILSDATAIGNASAPAISCFPPDPGNLIYGKDSA